MFDFYTSDWHLCHTNIIKWCNRPFANSDEMNKVIISNYKDLVNEGDYVAFVGDICFYRHDLIKSLPGKKYLIKGNHDKKTYSYYKKNGFEMVMHSIEFLIGEAPVKICHKPEEKNICIHGHLHSNKPETKYGIDVGVDAWKFFPVPESEVFKIIHRKIQQKEKEL